jgi:hypothetical protein
METMIRRLLIALTLPWLYALLLGTALLGTLAYQAVGDVTIVAGEDRSAVYLINFDQPEAGPDRRFRWSSPTSFIRLPGLGAYPLTLRVRMAGELPRDADRLGEVLVNEVPVATFHLQAGWQDYTFPIRAEQIGLGGNARIRVRLPALQVPGDPRLLGAPVDQIVLQRQPGSLAWPAPAHLAAMLLAALAVYLGAVGLGVAPRGAALVGAALSVLWAAALAGAHMDTAFAAPRLLPVLWGTLAGLLLARGVAGRLCRRGGVVPGRRDWWALGAAFAAGALVKAGGLFHPAFMLMDHAARLHQLDKFGRDPLGFLQTYIAAPPDMGLGGQLDLGTAIPYSPFFYIVFSPLNVLVPDEVQRLDALNLLMALLEASSVFALYYVLRRGWRDGPAGACAALAFVSLPLTNLLFSDGGYPSILAQWLLVITTAALAAAYPRLGRPLVLVPLAALLAAALVSHTSITLLLGVLLVVFVGLVAAFDRPRLAPVAVWSALGMAGAFFSYYVFSLPVVFGQILPTVLARLRAGGSVGQDPAKLGAPLLHGFWPQIAAHFQTWPLLLGLAGYVARGLGVGGGGLVTACARPSRALVPIVRRGLTLWFGAWLVSFALFSLLDLRVNLLQKHMLFALPLLALLSGLALGPLWRGSRAGRLLVALLLAVLAWASLQVWLARVLLDVLPPGSG